MAKFSDLMIEERDLDLFFQVQDIPVHIATYGSPIPEVLNDIDIQADLLEKVTQEQPIHGNVVQINQKYLEDNVIGDGYCALGTDLRRLAKSIRIEGEEGMPQHYSPELQLFCHSFYRFAQRGFYSFDYSPDANSFFLVAWPSKNRKTTDLPVLNLAYVIDFSKPTTLTEIIFNK